jgi:hypothetical protein
VDGISDFDTLHSGKHDEEVQLCAFDILVRAATIYGSCRCICVRPALNGRWRGGPSASSSTRSSVARLAPISIGRHAGWA